MVSTEVAQETGEGRLVFDRRRFRPAQVGSCAFTNHDLPKSYSPNKLGFRTQEWRQGNLLRCFFEKSFVSIPVSSSRLPLWSIRVIPNGAGARKPLHPGAQVCRWRSDNPIEVIGQGCLLARHLIEHDVRAVEVSYQGWAMHNSVFITAPEKCAILDRAMGALLADLERIEKLDDTVVALTTEFGRTPHINENAGRDHHPKAFSSVLAGGGIKGGTVYGKTNEGGEKVIENPVKITDFNATIAYAMGLPLDQILYSPSMRPFTVAHKGKPVLDLFS